MHPVTCIDGTSELFYWMLLVPPKPPFSMYHFEIKLYTQFSIWKKLIIVCPITWHISCCSAVLIWSMIRKVVPVFSNEYIFHWFCISIFPILFLYFCSRNSYIPIYLKPPIAWRPATAMLLQMKFPCEQRYFAYCSHGTTGKHIRACRDASLLIRSEDYFHMGKGVSWVIHTELPCE